MALAADLKTSCDKIFKSKWSVRNGTVVPEVKDIQLGNDAVCLDPATVLYADLGGSTRMVNQYTWQFAAEVYKTFLDAAARLVKDNGGNIVAYDGDRIMGVFIGGSKNTNAVRCALQINYAGTKLIQPSIDSNYSGTTFKLRYTVGIDSSTIHAARIGVRNDNDLVWVGRAANYAAKLTDLDQWPYTSWITKPVFDGMNDSVKFGGVSNKAMWEPRVWNAQGQLPIYRSNWTWRVD